MLIFVSEKNRPLLLAKGVVEECIQETETNSRTFHHGMGTFHATGTSDLVVVDVTSH